MLLADAARRFMPDDLSGLCKTNAFFKWSFLRQCREKSANCSGRCPVPIADDRGARIPRLRENLHGAHAISCLDCGAHVRGASSLMKGLNGQMLRRGAGPSPKGGLSRCVKPPCCSQCPVHTAASIQRAPSVSSSCKILRRGHDVRCSLSQRSVADQRKQSSPMLLTGRTFTQTVLPCEASPVTRFSAAFVLQRHQRKECPGQRSGWPCQARGEWRRTLCSC